MLSKVKGLASTDPMKVVVGAADDGLHQKVARGQEAKGSPRS